MRNSNISKNKKHLSTSKNTDSVRIFVCSLVFYLFFDIFVSFRIYLKGLKLFQLAYRRSANIRSLINFMSNYRCNTILGYIPILFLLTDLSAQYRT